jgi:hypothetical protein
MSDGPMSVALAPEPGSRMRHSRLWSAARVAGAPRWSRMPRDARMDRTPPWAVTIAGSDGASRDLHRIALRLPRASVRRRLRQGVHSTSVRRDWSMTYDGLPCSHGFARCDRVTLGRRDGRDSLVGPELC